MSSLLYLNESDVFPFPKAYLLLVSGIFFVGEEVIVQGWGDGSVVEISYHKDLTEALNIIAEPTEKAPILKW